MDRQRMYPETMISAMCSRFKLEGAARPSMHSYGSRDPAGPSSQLTRPGGQTEALHARHATPAGGRGSCTPDQAWLGS